MTKQSSTFQVTVPAYEGPYADADVTSYAPGTFLERIEDDSTREALAAHISTNGLYGQLDCGEGFDDALKTTLALTISNKRLLDTMIEEGGIPDGTWSEPSWHAALDAMLANERPDFEPGRVRKWLAGLVLRQEVQGRKYAWSLVPWRERSPTSSQGVIG